jgi:excisionase family DNA binding protein
MTERVLAVDIREAARQLSLSVRTIATLVARRELPSRKVGRRRIIPVAALEAFIVGRTAQPTDVPSMGITHGKNKTVPRASEDK